MNELKKSIHDNANGLDYTLVNDHYALATEHPEVCQRKARGEAGGVTYQVRGAALAIQPVRVS